MKKSLVEFLLSDKAVYVYQNYQILNWLSQKGYMSNDLYPLLRERINADSPHQFFANLLEQINEELLEEKSV